MFFRITKPSKIVYKGMTQINEIINISSRKICICICQVSERQIVGDKASEGVDLTHVFKTIHMDLLHKLSCTTTVCQ